MHDDEVDRAPARCSAGLGREGRVLVTGRPALPQQLVTGQFRPVRTRPARTMLTALRPGARGTVVNVGSCDPEIFRYLDDYRLGLGDRVEVLWTSCSAASLRVRIVRGTDDHSHTLGWRLAALLEVELDP